jgi:hypothetical protein
MFDVELPLPDRKAMPVENPDAPEACAPSHIPTWSDAWSVAQG